jgi:hypothetical protein
MRCSKRGMAPVVPYTPQLTTTMSYLPEYSTGKRITYPSDVQREVVWGIETVDMRA